MTHDDVRDRLGDYLEGDLAVGARSRVDAHLAACPACREELRSLRATVALLRGLPDPEPPARLIDAVLAGIDAQRERREASSRIALGRAAVALAAGLAVLALLTWSRQTGAPYEPGTLQPARTIARVSEDAAGDVTTWIRRPPVDPSPAASTSSRYASRGRPARVAAFRGGGVAPMVEIDELPGVGLPSPELELSRQLDRELERLLGDPGAFLRRMGPDVRGERFARLAQHAARRGQAARVASRLIAVPHPLADDLIPRFLAASLSVDQERRQGPE